jgi:hypothetical protein
LSQDRIDDVEDLTGEAGLGQLLQQLSRRINVDLRVAAPATVIAYDSASQLVDVMLVPSAVRRDDIPTAPIVVPQIPVLIYGGLLSYVAPVIAPGDAGLCVFMDRSADQWLSTGIPGDPINPRTHNVADAVFLPGLTPRTIPRVGVNPAALVIESPIVRLGSGATEYALRGTALAAVASDASDVITNLAFTTADATALNAMKGAVLAVLEAISAAVSVKVQIQ